MATQRPVHIDSTTGNVRELVAGDKLGGVTNGTATGEVITFDSISDTAYDATNWDGVTDIAPSKNALRDKLETMAILGANTFTADQAVNAKYRIGSSVVGVLIDSDLGGVPETAADNVLYVASTTGAGTALFDKIVNATTDGAGIITRRARGTPASPIDVVNGDQIGYMDFRSYSGTKFFQQVSIAANVDGTFTSGQAPPSRLIFATNIANGGSTERMRLTKEGYLLLGTSSMPSFSADARMVVKQAAGTSDFVATFQGGTNSGTSYGITVKGGTTTADYGLTVADATNANELFRVKGAGNTWVSNAVVVGRTVSSTPIGSVDALYGANPTANAQTAYGAYLETDTTNSGGYTSYQPIGVAGTVRYRGTTSESTSTKGARAFDGSMFVYNTGITQYASGTRYDIRNLGTGTVTHMAGVWVPPMLNSGGGTITTTYGVRCEATTTGTTNYGIHSATALNYFAGEVMLGTTTSGSAALTFGEAKDIAFGSTTGTKIGGASAKLAFYGATPVVRAAAYTQTYSTAARTHSAQTAATLTDNTAGTPTTTLEALTSGAVYATDVAAIRNNFADLAAMVNKLTADNLVQAQLINSLIDDLQAIGIAQ